MLLYIVGCKAESPAKKQASELLATALRQRPLRFWSCKWPVFGKCTIALPDHRAWKPRCHLQHTAALDASRRPVKLECQSNSRDALSRDIHAGRLVEMHSAGRPICTIPAYASESSKTIAHDTTSQNRPLEPAYDEAHLISDADVASLGCTALRLTACIEKCTETSAAPADTPQAGQDLSTAPLLHMSSLEYPTLQVTHTSTRTDMTISTTRGDTHTHTQRQTHTL